VSGAEVVIVTGWSNGNSFGGSAGNSLGECQTSIGSGGLRWPVPTWKFGLRLSDDRGDM
jgi:hypothetical protein